MAWNDPTTRRTVGTLAAFGAVLGLAAAVVLHGLPAGIVGDYGFFAYLAPSASLSPYPIHVTLNWWPSLGILAGGGLLLGAVVGALLRRRGWGLVRTDP